MDARVRQWTEGYPIPFWLCSLGNSLMIIPAISCNRATTMHAAQIATVVHGCCHFQQPVDGYAILEVI
jgi:hypothetical protein